MELDLAIAWALVAEGERQKNRVTEWVLSFDDTLAEDELRRTAITEFVVSLRGRALNDMCSQFLALRRQNTRHVRTIHAAACTFENEFAELREVEGL